jgi:tetratricopeptide (TPR) repeat protein
VGLGLAAGVLALLLQSQVDFGLELFGIGSLFWIALAMGDGANEEGASGRPLARFVPAGLAVLAGIVVLATQARPLHLERNAMKRRFAASGLERGAGARELEATLRGAVLRHPGDGYLPLLGGYLATREGKNPLRWFGRALERNPTSGRANFALAEALGAAHHEEQALIHLRLAAAYDHALADRALNLAVAFSPTVPELTAGFPEGAIGGEAFVDLCPKLQPPARIPCFREALRRNDRDVEAHEALSSELFDAIEERRAPCSGPDEAACVAEAERSVAKMGTATGYRGLILGARLRARKGDRAGAVGMLLSGCPATPTAAACLELAMDLAIGLADPALTRQAQDRFVALACELSARCAAAHARVGERLEGIGDVERALAHFTAAARESPSASRWLKVADLALRAGSPAAKRAALAEATAHGGLSDGQRRELQRLSTAAPGFGREP